MPKRDIIKLYVVVLPSIVCWPGKVMLHISYTKTDCWVYIDNYPNRLFAAWMTVEEREIITYETG